MPLDLNAENFYIVASWPARCEGPDLIAQRLRRFLDGLGQIDETLVPWSIGKRRWAPYSAVRDDLPAMIREDVKRDECGAVERAAGYTILGSAEDPRQRYLMIGHDGGTYKTFLCNEMSLSTYSDTAVDTTIVTYPVMKALVLALITCWDPAFCLAGSSGFAVTGTRYERSCWITYVPPPHAASVDLVGVPFSEGTPDGGLLLSATDQPYDAANPVHLAGTRRIVEATRHLNATLPKL